MCANDGARLSDPVLHAVESLLNPLAEEASALGVIGVHRAGVDPRTRRNALLDELLQPLDAALSRANPVDKYAVAVLHLDDGLYREECAEGRLRAGDTPAPAQVLERVDQREDLDLSREAPCERDRVVEAAAVAQHPGARG